MKVDPDKATVTITLTWHQIDLLSAIMQEIDDGLVCECKPTQDTRDIRNIVLDGWDKVHDSFYKDPI